MKKESPDIMKTRILSSLKASDGLTIKEMSEKLGIHHVTASKYLAVLEAEKRVLCKKIGMAKVFKVAAYEKSLSEFEALRRVS
jgi:predicted ArsR family transcriptional regulator